MLAFALILIAAAVIFTAAQYNSLTKAKNRIELAEQELAKYEETGSDRDVENAKKYYYAVLRDYNNMVESFPSSLIADMFNFPKMHGENFDEGL